MSTEKKVESKKKRDYSEIRIRGIAQTRRQLKNIADNLGIDFHVFMKSEFAKIIASYPEKMRQAKPDY